MNNSLILFACLLFFCGCAQLHASKGWGLLHKGRADEAIEEFELLRNSKELPGYYLGMYYSYVEKKDVAKAREYIETGVERYPNDFHLNYAMGYFLLKVADDNNRAVEYFKKCKVLDIRKQFTEELDTLISESKG